MNNQVCISEMTTIRPCNISRANTLKSIPLLNEELAEVVGHLHGDGCVFTDKNRKGEKSILFCSNDIENIRNFSDAFKYVFDYDLKVRLAKEIHNGNKNYDVRLSSVELVDFLETLCAFDTYNWNIPEFVKEGSIRIKARYLRAFFDDEGCFKKDMISCTSNNKAGLLQVEKLLKDLDIVTNFHSEKYSTTFGKGITYKIQIYGQHNIRAFYEAVGFGISRKKVRCESYLRQTRYLSTAEEYEQAIIMRLNGFSHKKILDSLASINPRFIGHDSMLSRWFYGKRIPYPKVYVKYKDKLNMIPRNTHRKDYCEAMVC